jgi:hypothetical protein
MLTPSLSVALIMISQSPLTNVSLTVLVEGKGFTGQGHAEKNLD